MVIAAAATREGARVRPVVSMVRALSENWRYPPVDDIGEQDPNQPLPLLPAFPLPPDGFVLRETAGGWQDQQHSAFAGSGDDRPLKSDPVLDFALGPGGPGWAVGGWSGDQDAADSGSSGRGAAGKADRARVQTAAVFRFGDQAATPPGAAHAPVDLPAGPARLAVGGHAACQAPCADLALQEIRPGPLPGLGAGEGRGAARAAARAPHDALHGRALAEGVDPRVGPRERGQLRVPARVAACARLPGAVRDATCRTSTRSAPRSATSSPRSGAARRRPAWTRRALPARRASAGRPHPLRLRLHRPGGHGARDRDRQLGGLAGRQRRPPEPARGTRRRGCRPTLADAKAQRHPGDRDGQPRPELALHPRAQRRRRRRRGRAHAGRRRRVGVLLRAPGGEPRLPIPAGGGDTIPAFGTGTLGYRSPIIDPPARPAGRACSATAGFLLAEVDAAKRDPATNRAPVTVRLIPLIEDLSLQRGSTARCCAAAGRRCSRASAAGRAAGDRWGSRRRTAARTRLAPTRTCRSRPAVPDRGCSTRLVTPEYEFISSDPDIARLRRAGPELDQPAQAVHRRRRQRSSDSTLGPAVRVQRGHHDASRSAPAGLLLAQHRARCWPAACSAPAARAAEPEPLPPPAPRAAARRRRRRRRRGPPRRRVAAAAAAAGGAGRRTPPPAPPPHSPTAFLPADRVAQLPAAGAAADAAAGASPRARRAAARSCDRRGEARGGGRARGVAGLRRVPRRRPGAAARASSRR